MSHKKDARLMWVDILGFSLRLARELGKVHVLYSQDRLNFYNNNDFKLRPAVQSMQNLHFQL